MKPKYILRTLFSPDVSDVTLNKKAKQQIAETMMNENKKQDPSKDVHLQALKIFINLFPKGKDCRQLVIRGLKYLALFRELNITKRMTAE